MRMEFVGEYQLWFAEVLHVHLKQLKSDISPTNISHYQVPVFVFHYILKIDKIIKLEIINKIMRKIF